MGYALFTARKLALQSRVNNLNAQLMAISNQQNALTDQITNKQMMSDLRSANATANAYSIFQKSGQSDSDTATLQSTLAQNEKTNTMSNIEITNLQSKVNALDTTREALETQLNAASNELQAVEKAEESAIKNATPQYVA